MMKNTWILGVDVGPEILQISCFQKNQEEITEDFYEMASDGQNLSECLIEKIHDFLEEQQLPISEGEKIVISFSQPAPGKIKTIRQILMDAGFPGEKIRIISRENAFVHYVMGQEASLYEHTVLLFDFDGKELYGYRLEHSKKKMPKKFQVESQLIGSFSLLGDLRQKGKVFDEHFASIARQLLSKEVVSAVYLTGKGFEGDWLSKSLNVLCNGRRAFIGQNLFSGGCCYFGLEKEDRKKDFMICAPETVVYDSGVIDSAQEEIFVPITKAGDAWYETRGSLEIIPERGGKIDIVFSSTLLGEKQVESVDISALPQRPRKTGRLFVEVIFLGSKHGLITIRDLGFGAFSPATNQVFLKEFQLL